MIYKGREGQWAWVFHRVTGLGVLVFLALHIADTILVGFGPEIYDKVIGLYRHPVFKLGEVGLVAAVLYHALNGMRIIVFDFWPRAARYHRQMFYAAMAVLLLAMGPVTYLMLLAQRP